MSDKIRIAVLVSGGGTNLPALLDAQAAGVITSGEIALVVSNKSGVYALERAARAGIPAETVTQKDNSGNQEAIEQALLAVLERHRIDLVVLAGFLSILSAGFIRKYENRIIDVHPCLIPTFCGKGYYGLKVHEAALAYGVKVTGATVHLVNEILDGGRILLQKAVDILPGDTAEVLQKRVMEQAEWKLLPRATELVAHQLLEEKTHD